MQAHATNPSALEVEQSLLSDRLAALRDAIALLERAEVLRSDAAARLAMYRQNEERLVREIQALEYAIGSREKSGAGDAADGPPDLAGDLLQQLAADRAARDAGE